MAEKWLIGVDVGGTTTKMALIKNNGNMVGKWEIPSNNENGGKWITVDIAKSIEQKLNGYNVKKEQIKGIGVGAPGPANQENGIIYHTPNLAWHDHYPLRDILERETHLPVIINNDANCAALGEMWQGAGEGAKDLVCVTLGTGVGGGIIINGNIVQGVRSAAGEIGHITSIPNGGARCNCGKTGCLETIASATGIVRLATERVKSGADKSKKLTNLFEENGRLTAKDVFDLTNGGDETALGVVKEITFYLGLALANIANTLNPEKIVIGGGVSRAGHSLLASLITNFQKFAFPNVASSTELALAKLGNDAGVFGAAFMINNEK